jgi:hypothetical protein
LIIITLCNHGFQVREAEKEASKLQRARYNERKGLVKRTERLVSDGLEDNFFHQVPSSHHFTSFVSNIFRNHNKSKWEQEHQQRIDETGERFANRLKTVGKASFSKCCLF